MSHIWGFEQIGEIVERHILGLNYFFQRKVEPGFTTSQFQDDVKINAFITRVILRLGWSL